MIREWKSTEQYLKGISYLESLILQWWHLPNADGEFEVIQDGTKIDKRNKFSFSWVRMGISGVRFTWPALSSDEMNELSVCISRLWLKDLTHWHSDTELSEVWGNLGRILCEFCLQLNAPTGTQQNLCSQIFCLPEGFDFTFESVALWLLHSTKTPRYTRPTPRKRFQY